MMRTPHRLRGLTQACLLVALISSCSSKSSKPIEETEAEGGDSPKKPKKPRSGSAAATTSPPPAAGLQATMDGTPVELKQAFIKQRDDVFQLYATTDEATCSELLDNMFNHFRGEKNILLDLKTGPSGTSISEIYTGGRNGTLASGSSVNLEGAAAAGTKNSVTLDYVVMEDGKEMLRVKGSIVAEGCGSRPQ